MVLTGIIASLAAIVAVLAIWQAGKSRSPGRLVLPGFALVVAGTLAGAIFASGRLLPGGIVVAGGVITALAGWLRDGARLPAMAHIIIQAVIFAVVAALAIPLFLLRTSLGLPLPTPVIIALLALAGVLWTLVLARIDHRPGAAAMVVGGVGVVVVIFALWRNVLDVQSIWWLGALSVAAIVSAVVVRGRLGAIGISYLALTSGILVLTIAAFSRLAG